MEDDGTDVFIRRDEDNQIVEICLKMDTWEFPIFDKGRMVIKRVEE